MLALSCRRGPHLLAPTGSDLAKYTEVNTIFAGWHTDLNFLTIHGASRRWQTGHYTSS